MEFREEKPKVSVCVVTYNHQKHIRQCLQSLVDQETPFRYEIVVGDDCSTDGTTEIVQEFVQKYPEKVRALYHPQNIGPTKNYFAVHNAAQGKYIAHVDGDDYALEGKLAALAQVLDLKPMANIVWHRMKILKTETGAMLDDLIDVSKQPEGGFSRTDLLACGSVGAHSASMYRRAWLPVENEEVMDYYVTVERLGEGRGYWIDGFYGVYRQGGGIMVKSNKKYKRLFCDHLCHFLRKYPESRRHINSLALLLLLADIKNMRPPTTLKLWMVSIHPLGIVEFFRRLPLYRILRLPS